MVSLDTNPVSLFAGIPPVEGWSKRPLQLAKIFLSRKFAKTPLFSNFIPFPRLFLALVDELFQQIICSPYT